MLTGINNATRPVITSYSIHYTKLYDVSGALPILWIGLGAIFAGILLSNWMGGVPRQISDILRIVVLVALYPTVYQFTNIMIFEESSFTLIPPLLGGLAATLISATILFKKYRRHKNQEMISD